MHFTLSKQAANYEVRQPQRRETLELDTIPMARVINGLIALFDAHPLLNKLYHLILRAPSLRLHVLHILFLLNGRQDVDRGEIFFAIESQSDLLKGVTLGLNHVCPSISVNCRQNRKMSH